MPKKRPHRNPAITQLRTLIGLLRAIERAAGEEHLDRVSLASAVGRVLLAGEELDFEGGLRAKEELRAAADRLRGDPRFTGILERHLPDPSNPMRLELTSLLMELMRVQEDTTR